MVENGPEDLVPQDTFSAPGRWDLPVQAGIISSDYECLTVDLVSSLKPVVTIHRYRHKLSLCA